MLVRDIVFYASAFILPFVDGRSIFDLGQEVISDPDFNAPLTITVQTETTISRPAEIAIVNLLVTGSGPTDDAAREEALTFANQLEYILTEFSKQCQTPVESWKRSQIHMRSPYGDSDDFFAYDSFEVDNGLGRHKATARFSIRFDQVNDVQDFVRMLTSNSGVSLEYADWELTEQTLADLKGELRTKAINKIMAAGEDYARAFGKTSVKPLAFKELYTYSGMKFDRHGMYMDDVNLEPQDVEIETTVKCKFSTA